MQNHQKGSQTSFNVNEPVRCTGSFHPSHNFRDAEAGKGLRGQNEIKSSVVGNTHFKFSDGFSNHTTEASHIDESAEVLANKIDDDEILEVTHIN